MRQEHRADAREALQLILRASKARTVRSVYGRLAPSLDGRITTVISPAATDTGRLASSETFLEPSTNLQNLPNKVSMIDPLYNVRSVICPSEGMMLGEADLSQAEARVGAYMSQDTLAMQQYEEGVDRYKVLAAALYYDDPTRIDDVSKWQRHVGKMGQLAFQFCVGWKTFMEQVNGDVDITGGTINAKTAKAAEATFKELHPRYPVWWAEVLDEVLTKGFLINPYGRKRIFFDRVTDEYSKSQLQRKAVAFLPQSTIADRMNQRIRWLYDRYDPSVLKILLQVHDAVLFECAPRDQRKVARLVRETLEEEPLTIHGRTFSIPAEVEMSSKNWAEKKLVAA